MLAIHATAPSTAAPVVWALRTAARSALRSLEVGRADAVGASGAFFSLVLFFRFLARVRVHEVGGPIDGAPGCFGRPGPAAEGARRTRPDLGYSSRVSAPQTTPSRSPRGAPQADPGALEALYFNPHHIERKLLWQSIAAESGSLEGRMLDVGCGDRPYAPLFRHVERYVGLEHPGAVMNVEASCAAPSSGCAVSSTRSAMPTKSRSPTQASILAFRPRCSST